MLDLRRREFIGALTTILVLGPLVGRASGIAEKVPTELDPFAGWDFDPPTGTYRNPALSARCRRRAALRVGRPFRLVHGKRWTFMAPGPPDDPFAQLRSQPRRGQEYGLVWQMSYGALPPLTTLVEGFARLGRANARWTALPELRMAVGDPFYRRTVVAVYGIGV
jgi:hypothetical protein